MTNRKIRCAGCGSWRRKEARGLCHRCYVRERARGTLDEFWPSKLRRRAEVIAEYEFLHEQHPGDTVGQLARVMGLSQAALEQHLSRHRRAQREGASS